MEQASEKSKWIARPNKALFSSKKFLVFCTIALSFLFNKYYPIMD